METQVESWELLTCTCSCLCVPVYQKASAFAFYNWFNLSETHWRHDWKKSEILQLNVADIYPSAATKNWPCSAGLLVSILRIFIKSQNTLPVRTSELFLRMFEILVEKQNKQLSRKDFLVDWRMQVCTCTYTSYKVWTLEAHIMKILLCNRYILYEIKVVDEIHHSRRCFTMPL